MPRVMLNESFQDRVSENPLRSPASVYFIATIRIKRSDVLTTLSQTLARGTLMAVILTTIKISRLLLFLATRPVRFFI